MFSLVPAPITGKPILTNRPRSRSIDSPPLDFSSGQSWDTNNSGSRAAAALIDAKRRMLVLYCIDTHLQPAPPPAAGKPRPLVTPRADPPPPAVGKPRPLVTPRAEPAAPPPPPVRQQKAAPPPARTSYDEYDYSQQAQSYDEYVAQAPLPPAAPTYDEYDYSQQAQSYSYDPPPPPPPAARDYPPPPPPAKATPKKQPAIIIPPTINKPAPAINKPPPVINKPAPPPTQPRPNPAPPPVQARPTPAPPTSSEAPPPPPPITVGDLRINVCDQTQRPNTDFLVFRMDIEYKGVKWTVSSHIQPYYSRTKVTVAKVDTICVF